MSNRAVLREGMAETERMVCCVTLTMHSLALEVSVIAAYAS